MAVALLVALVVSSLEWPHWLVSVPSVAASYGLLFATFNRWGWKTKLARAFGLSRVPDLSGHYRGTLDSTYEAPGAPMSKEVEFEIRQSWTQIEVVLTTSDGTSRSESFMAAITGDETRSRLSYAYRNQVQPAIAESDMADHDGTAELVADDGDVLRGRYFTTRSTQGSIRVRR